MGKAVCKAEILRFFLVLRSSSSSRALQKPELLLGKSYGINYWYNVVLLTCMCRFLSLLWKHAAKIPDNELVDCFSNIADHYTSNSVSKSISCFLERLDLEKNRCR